MLKNQTPIMRLVDALAAELDETSDLSPVVTVDRGKLRKLLELLKEADGNERN